MKHLLRRAKDPVSAAAKIMANTSGIVGVLGLVINQYGGKMSDLFGRHAFWFVGPLTSILSGLMVHTFSHNLFVVMACRILRLVTTTFSSSVMIGTVLSDVASGSVLAAAGAKTGAFVGAAIVVAPVLEGFILKATQQNLRKPYLGLATLGCLHSLYLYYYMPETNKDILTPTTATTSKPFSWSINPLSFFSLYQKDPTLDRVLRTLNTTLSQHRAKYLQTTDHISSTTATTQALVEKKRILLKCMANRAVLKKMVTINTLQSFLEGKNVTDLVQIWQREHLNWDVFGMRDFTVVYGILCVGTGALLTPWLLKSLVARKFTTLTNWTNTIGFVLRGATENAAVFWCCIPLMLPGVNGASGGAIKALSIERAIAAGIQRGELSAYLNNLRAVASSFAPMLYGNMYAFFRSAKMFPGLTFTVAAVVGGLLPELLHQSMEVEEVVPLTEQDKEDLKKGLEMCWEEENGGTGGKGGGV